MAIFHNVVNPAGRRWFRPSFLMRIRWPAGSAAFLIQPCLQRLAMETDFPVGQQNFIEY